MSVLIDNRTDFKISCKRLEQIYEKAVKIGVLPKGYELDVCLCESDFICQYNKDYRGLAAKTDVLSFELSEFAGSVLICLEYLWERSGKEQFEQDLFSVFAHGICHLSGDDHITLEQRKLMSSREKMILEM